MKNKNTLIIVSAVIVVIAIIAGIFVLRSKQGQKKSGSDNLPAENIIPTVDSSVVVELKPGSKKGEATLTVKNAPAGTKAISYELTYEAQGASDEGDSSAAIPQGAIGKCTQSGSIWECGEPSASGRKIVLGTCSSGVCRYHKVVGPVKVTLKFNGSYGDKIFEKEYEL